PVPGRCRRGERARSSDAPRTRAGGELLMRWALAALCFAVGCTQDFDQFVVTGGAHTATTTGGGGGGAAGGGIGGDAGHGGTPTAAGGGGQGGSGGMAPLCGERPDPPGDVCPDECSRCEDGTCFID